MFVNGFMTNNFASGYKALWKFITFRADDAIFDMYKSLEQMTTGLAGIKGMHNQGGIHGSYKFYASEPMLGGMFINVTVPDKKVHNDVKMMIKNIKYHNAVIQGVGHFGLFDGRRVEFNNVDSNYINRLRKANLELLDAIDLVDTWTNAISHLGKQNSYVNIILRVFSEGVIGLIPFIFATYRCVIRIATNAMNVYGGLLNLSYGNVKTAKRIVKQATGD